MSSTEPKISAFCLTTNSIKNQFPFIESIKSFLNIVDELIVVDGGSTDGTIEAIQNIGDNKIKIINDERTKWEDEWYYSRLGKNFNRGLEECSGDIRIKFDVDFIVHEASYTNTNKNFRKDCKQMFDQNKLTLGFSRHNFIITDRLFVKSKRTLGINYTECLKQHWIVRYGLDLERGHWSFEPIVNAREENGIYFGDLLRTRENCHIPCFTLYNYDCCFLTKDIIAEKRYKGLLAEIKQKTLKYKIINNPSVPFSEEHLKNNPDIAYGLWEKNNIGTFKSVNARIIDLKVHPEIIRDKIKNLKPEQAGYNCFGKLTTSKYYA